MGENYSQSMWWFQLLLLLKFVPLASSFLNSLRSLWLLVASYSRWYIKLVVKGVNSFKQNIFNFCSCFSCEYVCNRWMLFPHTAIGSKTSGVDFVGTPVSAEMSPISQTSPISMSPLSGSPLSSGVNSPIASNTVIGNTQKSSVLMKIHSRRFRE